MVEAGFLATETRRRTKGRPAKVYFTWEGEGGSLEEAGVDIPAEDRHRDTRTELEVEVRMLERMLADATGQLSRIREVMEEHKHEGGTDA